MVNGLTLMQIYVVVGCRSCRRRGHVMGLAGGRDEADHRSVGLLLLENVLRLKTLYLLLAEMFKMTSELSVNAVSRWLRTSFIS